MPSALTLRKAWHHPLAGALTPRAHPKVLCEGADVVAPVVGVGAEAVDEEDRGAGGPWGTVQTLGDRATSRGRWGGKRHGSTVLWPDEENFEGLEKERHTPSTNRTPRDPGKPQGKAVLFGSEDQAPIFRMLVWGF